MNSLEKYEIYDRMSKLLTDYEIPEDAAFPVKAGDLYTMLVEIQNKWEELTGNNE